MKNSIKRITLLLFTALVLAACSSTQSLQEYYVDNQENPNFISIDLPRSLLKMDQVDLTKTQKEALESLTKLNVLAFRKTTDNADAYKTEKAKVKAILKNDKFVELMKLNSKAGKGVIKYLGDEDAIDEVVIYGNSDEQGFALVRVLGDDMNPAHIMELLKVIEKSEYRGEGLEQLGALLKG